MGFSGLLQQLIDANELVLYHDYRSGSFYDFSSNSNVGVPTSTVWQGPGKGIGFPAEGSQITVSDSSELQLTDGTIVCLGEFVSQTASEGLVSKRDAGGTNYQFYMNATQLIVFDGLNNRTLGTSVVGKKCVAVNLESGENAEAFVDGISVGTFNNTSIFTADDAPINIGEGTGLNNLESPLSAVLIINRKLTATEHAELYAQLNSLQWPTKQTSFASPSLDAQPSEANLVGAWGGKPVGGVWVDRSGNGNNGTITGAMSNKSLLGDGMVFDGVDDNVFVVSAQTAVTEEFTFHAWVKPYDITAVNQIFADNGNRKGLYLQSGNGELRSRLKIDGSYRTETSGALVPANQYSCVDLVRNQLSTSMYINGVLVYYSEAYPGDIESSIDIYIGMYGDGVTSPFNGSIQGVEFYDEAKSQAWVTREYQKGALATQFKTSFAIQDTVANVTSGQISNSPFTASTGSWKISTETINNKVCKVLENVAAGICYAKTSDMFGSSTEMAYGSWEWWMYKDLDGSVTAMYITNDDITLAADNGLRASIQGNESIALYRRTGGANANTIVTTAAAYADLQTWYKIKVTRTSGNDFVLYCNDVSVGSDSDAVVATTSDYVVLDFDAGDKICLSSSDGSMNIIKQLGVIS